MCVQTSVGAFLKVFRNVQLLSFNIFSLNFSNSKLDPVTSSGIWNLDGEFWNVAWKICDLLKMKFVGKFWCFVTLRVPKPL